MKTSGMARPRENVEYRRFGTILVNFEISKCLQRKVHEGLLSPFQRAGMK